MDIHELVPIYNHNEKGDQMSQDRNSNLVINFIIRTCIGMGIIFFANQFLSSRGSSVLVGYNALSALTVGALGLPGIALLYGIMFYQNL